MDNYNNNPNTSADYDPEYEYFRQFKRNNPTTWQNMMSPRDNYGMSQNSPQNFANSSHFYQNYQQNFDTYPQNYQNSEDSYFQSYTIIPETQNSYDQYEIKDDASDVGCGRGKKVAVKKKNTGKEATTKEKIPWEKAEDEVLIASFMKHSTDAVASTNQKATQLWSKVQKSFEEAQRQRPYEIHVRNGNMLRSRRRRIATAVTKWVPAYDAATKRMSSGQNEGDVLKNAVKIYEHQHGNWDFDHAWRLLRNYNKWEELVNPREKNTESEQPSSDSGKRKFADGGCATPETPATDDDVFGGASSRPIGIKKSKELARGKFKEDPNITNFAARLQLHDEAAAKREDMRQQRLDFEREKERKRQEERAQYFQLEQEKLEWDKKKMKLTALYQLMAKSNLTPQEEKFKDKLMCDVGDYL
ncbi:hypothetical protein OROHE_012213 [Orobanche hederae]